MGKIDELVLFRRAKESDVDDIMNYIKAYWNKNHILANHKEFFLYEYGNRHINQQNDDINFLLAFNRVNKELIAIYGFYIYSRDDNDRVLDMAGGLSHVKQDCGIPFVGISIYQKLFDFLNPRNVVGVGLNLDTSYRIMDRYFHFNMGKLEHYYRLSDKDDYKIAVISDKNILPINEARQARLIEIFSLEELKNHFYTDQEKNNREPYKDYTYVEWRYFMHPVYRYRCFCADNQLVLFTREVHHEDRIILRIVDVLGDVECIRWIGQGIQQLIETEQYEYIDFMESGISDDIMNSAGFTRLDEDSDNIIPNYFEPFEQSNIDVYCYCSLKDKSVVLCKADADQDRPNLI